MKKALISLAAAAAIAAGAVMVPDTADASSRGRRNTAIAIGIGAVVLGAIIANQYRYERGYVRYRSYRRSHPVSCRDGYWARKPVYRNGRVVGWSDPRFICP